MYEVTVRASDGRLNTDRMVTIKVTDADEAGEVEVPQDALIGVELTATLTDSDTGAPDPAQFIDQVWTWYRLGLLERLSRMIPDSDGLQCHPGGDLGRLHTGRCG